MMCDVNRYLNDHHANPKGGTSLALRLFGHRGEELIDSSPPNPQFHSVKSVIWTLSNSRRTMPTANGVEDDWPRLIVCFDSTKACRPWLSTAPVPAIIGTVPLMPEELKSRWRQQTE